MSFIKTKTQVNMRTKTDENSKIIKTHHRAKVKRKTLIVIKGKTVKLLLCLRYKRKRSLVFKNFLISEVIVIITRFQNNNNLSWIKT